MKYQLIEEYFETRLFQNIVQEYFNTVLGQIIAENTTLSAKGLFIVNNEVKRDYYDMPYHIHILNGLIPVLFIYERILIQEGWIDDPNTEIYLRIFILGFTFHDANKLFFTKQTDSKSDLEIGVETIDSHIDSLNVYDFFKNYDKHKSTIKYLALGTEDGTAISSGDYKISVKNRKHISEVQRELCHLADGLASIQNKSLESIEGLYNAISKSLKKIKNIIELPISYVKVRPNPYTLLSQNLLQITKKKLAQQKKKVLYSTHEGFIYWGNDLEEDILSNIRDAYLVGSQGDINTLDLTKIDAQKCKFGFIGSVPFEKAILDDITNAYHNNFLALSPNNNEKIIDFDNFVQLTKKLIEIYLLPIEVNIIDGKLILRFHENIENDDDIDFKTIYTLHKIQWLNTKKNKLWKKDFDFWINSDTKLYEEIILKSENNTHTISNIADLVNYIKLSVKSTNALFKTYINFIKTTYIVANSDNIDDYIENLQKNIIDSFTPKDGSENNSKGLIFDRYFQSKGNMNIQFLENYKPEIPIKKEMCAFTGEIGKIPYKSEVAFALKARGFSNRTITALNNNTSHISNLFAEENKLRASQFKVSDCNLVIYHDFFEAKLDIDKEIINSCVNAKNELSFLEDGTILFDKKAKFIYNIYNLEFIKLSPKVEPTFFLVRKCLRMTKVLGVRSFITGIMTPYQPHKAIFHFENAPRFLKLLKWDSIRLVELEEVLQEISLILTFGKNRIESNLLKIAKSRLAYFKIYYGLSDDEKRKVHFSLINFYNEYKNKFLGMTTTKELVELAVKIGIGFKSGSEETWLIRTALNYLRKYHKQQNSREDIIEKTCGEIYRKLRMKKHDREAIKDFSIAVYDKLFLKEWKGKILTINQEKDWIYQFAFLFKEKSLEIARTPKAKIVKKQLEKEGKEINEENVKALLPKENQRSSKQYLSIIENLK